MLPNDDQNVILPNMTAGCSMADMAITDDVLDCWDDLGSVLKNKIVTPITYMNSTADIKSLCGENDGVVCTSSNAEQTFEWALKKQGKILFLPDQHLGRNTASRMGISDDEMIVWDPFKSLGVNSEEDINKSKIILVHIIMLDGQSHTIGRAIQLRQIPAACIPSVYALPQ